MWFLLIKELKMPPGVVRCGIPNARKLAVTCRETACAKSFSFRRDLNHCGLELDVSESEQRNQREMDFTGKAAQEVLKLTSEA